MTKQEIYEQVVQLTSELHATNVAEKIFSAAKEGDPKKVEEVFETFKNKNWDLYLRIAQFGAEFSVGTVEAVFSSQKDKECGSYVFDPNTINAVTLYALILFSEIDDYYLFDWGTESSENFVKAIEDAGYKELAYFVDNWSICDYIGEGEQYQNVYECLCRNF